MVKGLEAFREHFKDFSDRYVLIGGTACDLAMSEVGRSFRATKDLDIVLCIESLDKSFVEAFWNFVKEGRYQVQETSTGRKRFYRFQKPDRDDYPFMLELFSRKPDMLTPAEGTNLTPIPTGEEISSLSAILLDDDYYVFLKQGAKVIENLSFVGPEHLIPLKARAWIDLADRKQSGEPIDSKDVKKHRNDVFRLYAIIDPNFNANIPSKVRNDMTTFIARIKDESMDLKSLGLRKATLSTESTAHRKKTVDLSVRRIIPSV